MLINNIKLIHTKDIEIIYNNNETNFENIFILDSSNNNINYITYACPIFFKENIIFSLYLSKKKNSIKNIENAFLFYSFMYQIAFGHFIEQCIPKVNYYLELKKNIPNLKFCIPLLRNNSLVKEICSLIKLKDDDIIILNHEIIYKIENFYYKNYDLGDYNLDKIYSFKLIRENLFIYPNTTFHRNVYLKKDQLEIKETDCFNIGKNRIIINEEELINELKKMNFEIITLGNCSLELKKKFLSNINILITQIGGNMFNLIFSNTPKHLLFLSNSFPLNYEYIKNLLPRLNYYTENDTECIINKEINFNVDPKNNTNNPFIVNINDIINYCKNKL